MRVSGVQSTINKLRKIQPPLLFRHTLRNAAEMIKGWVAEYPPSTVANDPGQERWYERGYGPRWLRSDGSVNGRRTSQTLGRRWSTSTSSTKATIGNNASYAPYVQGEKQQAWYHKKRNWRTIEDAVREKKDEVLEFLQEQVRRYIRG